MAHVPLALGCPKQTILGDTLPPAPPILDRVDSPLAPEDACGRMHVPRVQIKKLTEVV